MSDSDPHGNERWPDAERRSTTDRRRDPDRRRREHHPGGTEGRYIAGDRRRTQRRSRADRRDEQAWQPLELDDRPGEQRRPETALIAVAAEARARAHARYSGFKVGAALETAGGNVIAGCNIENATYGLTLCAERVALVKALSDGHSVFTRIAVVADTAEPTPPCGPCRQLLWEYCGDIEVILANLSGPTARVRLATLLPLPFDSRLLE